MSFKTIFIGTLLIIAILVVMWALVLLKRAIRYDWARWARGMPHRIISEWQVHGDQHKVSLGAVVAAIVLAGIAFYGQDVTGQALSMMFGILAFSLGVGGAIFLFVSILNLLGSALIESKDSSYSPLDTVMNQKAHGVAGHATESAVDAALRDQDEGGMPAPRFQD